MVLFFFLLVFAYVSGATSLRIVVQVGTVNCQQGSELGRYAELSLRSGFIGGASVFECRHWL